MDLRDKAIQFANNIMVEYPENKDAFNIVYQSYMAGAICKTKEIINSSSKDIETLKQQLEQNK